MKAIRKLLAMALVVAMVLSMSAFVFATEQEIQPRSCAHDLVPRQVRDRFFFKNPHLCGYYIDVYEECRYCDLVVITRGTTGLYRKHFVEGDYGYCWQCHHDGCYAQMT